MDETETVPHLQIKFLAKDFRLVNLNFTQDSLRIYNLSAETIPSGIISIPANATANEFNALVNATAAEKDGKNN